MSLDDFMDSVIAEDTKTASQNNKIQNNNKDNDILNIISAELNGEVDKVAAEVDKTAAEVTGNSAPKGEGEVTPAASSVTGINSDVQSATEDVIYPQANIAGCDPAEVAAGEIPAQVKPSEVEVISAGDGKSTTPNLLHKVPEAASKAADDGPGTGTGEKTAGKKVATKTTDEKESPEDIGVKIASGVINEMARVQQHNDLVAAVGILKESSLTADAINTFDLSGFGIDEQEKTANLEIDYIEKIATVKDISEDDIINAANQVIAFEKEAEFADEQGRQEAHEYHALQKQADAEEAVVDEANQEKVAALKEDPKAVEAINYLGELGVLEALQQ